MRAGHLHPPSPAWVAQTCDARDPKQARARLLPGGRGRGRAIQKEIGCRRPPPRCSSYESRRFPSLDAPTSSASPIWINLDGFGRPEVAVVELRARPLLVRILPWQKLQLYLPRCLLCPRHPLLLHEPSADCNGEVEYCLVIRVVELREFP